MKGVSFILTATLKDGQLVVLTAERKRSDLREWRKTERFYCPLCGEAVHLKVGDIVIPHFAHEKRSACTQLFSEGESPQHLNGKRLLFELLSARTERVILEPVIREVSQRPDLLVTNGAIQTPIEFQCSTIPISLLQSRTAGFRSIGMNPQWILHTPKKTLHQPCGIGVFQFTKFQEWFITAIPRESRYLLTFNPQTKAFHYFSHLLHVAGQRYIGIHHILPIRFQHFPFVLPTSPSMADLTEYAARYSAMREGGLQQSILLNRKGVQNPFLRSCYELRIMPLELPRWIGVPTTKSEAFREADYEWQLRLIHFMRREGITISHVRRRDIERFVYPFSGSSSNQVDACRQYIHFLIRKNPGLRMEETECEENLIMTLISARFLANEVQN